MVVFFFKGGFGGCSGWCHVRLSPGILTHTERDTQTQDRERERHIRTHAWRGKSDRVVASSELLRKGARKLKKKVMS